MRLKSNLLMVAVVASLALGHASARDISHIYFFGDSFTPASNDLPIAWTGLLTSHYGLGKTERNKQVFSIGGNGSPSWLAQRTTFFGTDPKIDAKTWVSSYTGPSEFSDQAQANVTIGAITYPELGAYAIAATSDAFLAGTDADGILFSTANPGPFLTSWLEARMKNVEDHLKALSDRGVMNFIVPNQMDNSIKEYGALEPPVDPQYKARTLIPIELRELVTEPTQTYLWNATLYQKLAELDHNILVPDFYQLIREVMGDSSVDDGANMKNYITPSKVVIHTEEGHGSTGPKAAREGFLDTTAHPSEEGYGIMNQYVVSLLESPALVGLVREAPMQYGDWLFDQVSCQLHMRQYHGAQGLQWMAMGQYQYQRIKPVTAERVGWNNHGGDVNFGFTNSHPKGLWGLSLNSYRQYPQFVGSRGEARVAGTLLSGFATWDAYPGVQLQGMLTAGRVDYRIQRNVKLGRGLGPANRQHVGRTHGHYFAAAAKVLMPYEWKKVQFVPFFSAHYQMAGMRRYDESYQAFPAKIGGIASTAMSFDAPARDSVKIAIGSQVKTEFQRGQQTFVPNLGVQVVYDYQPRAKNKIKYKPRGVPIYAKADIDRMPTLYGQANIGTEWHNRYVTVGINYYARLGNKGGGLRQHGGQVKLASKLF